MTSDYRPRIQPRPSPVGAIIFLAIGLVITSLLAYGIVHTGTHSPKVQKSLGASDVFHAGNAQALADEIASHGPIIYPDLIKQQRGTNIFVQHIGIDSKSGWYSFSARATSASTKCQVTWQASSHDFVDGCTHQTFPEKGTGLTQYKVNVVNGTIQVDLHQPIS